MASAYQQQQEQAADLAVVQGLAGANGTVAGYDLDAVIQDGVRFGGTPRGQGRVQNFADHQAEFPLQQHQRRRLDGKGGAPEGLDLEADGVD